MVTMHGLSRLQVHGSKSIFCPSPPSPTELPAHREFQQGIQYKLNKCITYWYLMVLPPPLPPTRCQRWCWYCCHLCCLRAVATGGAIGVVAAAAIMSELDPDEKVPLLLSSLPSLCSNVRGRCSSCCCCCYCHRR